jgi:hypothetical protein
MMKRFFVALAVAAVSPLVAPSSAQGGILRYLDELSGPGPFWGATAELRLGCWKGEEYYPGSSVFRTAVAPDTAAEKTARWLSIKTQCLTGLSHGKYPRVSFNVESGILWTHKSDNPILYDDGQKHRAYLVPIEAFVYWQPTLGLEVGAGGGMFIFWTSQGGDARPVIEPMRVDIRPFDAFVAKRKDRLTPRKWRFLRSLTFRQSLVFLPGKLDADTFGGGAGNTFKESNELLKSFEFVIDFAPFLRKLP